MLYAPFTRRMYAFLLDYLLILAYGVFGVGTLAFVFQPYVFPLFTSHPFIAESTGFLMMTLPVSLYFILCEQSKWQGTWGKKKAGLLVVDDRGNPISIFRSTCRTGMKFLPWEVAHFSIWQVRMPGYVSEVVLYVLFILVNLTILIFLTYPFLNTEKKNVYDRLAGTGVVRRL